MKSTASTVMTVAAIISALYLGAFYGWRATSGGDWFEVAGSVAWVVYSLCMATVVYSVEAAASERWPMHWCLHFRWTLRAGATMLFCINAAKYDCEEHLKTCDNLTCRRAFTHTMQGFSQALEHAKAGRFLYAKRLAESAVAKHNAFIDSRMEEEKA